MLASLRELELLANQSRQAFYWSQSSYTDRASISIFDQSSGNCLQDSTTSVYKFIYSWSKELWWCTPPCTEELLPTVRILHLIPIGRLTSGRICWRRNLTFPWYHTREIQATFPFKIMESISSCLKIGHTILQKNQSTASYRGILVAQARIFS